MLVAHEDDDAPSGPGDVGQPAEDGVRARLGGQADDGGRERRGAEEAAQLRTQQHADAGPLVGDDREGVPVRRQQQGAQGAHALATRRLDHHVGSTHALRTPQPHSAPKYHLTHYTT